MLSIRKLDEIIITDVIEAYTVHSPKNRCGHMYNRPHYGLSLCNYGKLTYTKNETNIVSVPTRAIILPKGQSYTFFGNTYGEFPLINFDTLDFFTDDILNFEIGNGKRCFELYEKIRQAFIMDGKKSEIMSLFYRLIHEISSVNNRKSIIYPAIDYVEKNYSEIELDNELLASKCNISEVYLRKKFVAELGVSPRQYVINIRIKAAEGLLSEGKLSVKEISEKCGFSNQYHFCRMFKQKNGVSPSEYSKENRGIFMI